MAYTVYCDGDWYDDSKSFGGAEASLKGALTEYALDFWKEHPDLEPFPDDSIDVPESVIDEWYAWRDGADKFWFADEYDRYTLSYDDNVKSGCFYDWGDWWFYPDVVKHLRAKI